MERASAIKDAQPTSKIVSMPRPPPTLVDTTAKVVMMPSRPPNTILLMYSEAPLSSKGIGECVNKMMRVRGDKTIRGVKEEEEEINKWKIKKGEGCVM